MKPLVFLLAVFFGMGHAQNLEAINSSSKALLGAINGSYELATGASGYLPGYGLQISIVNAERTTADQAIPVLTGLLKALEPTVQGLAEGDWISIYFRGTTDYVDRFDLVVRIRAGVLEVWLDGVLVDNT